MKEDKSIFAQGKDIFWKPAMITIAGIVLTGAISYIAWAYNKDFRNKEIALAQYQMMATAKATAISIQEFIFDDQADIYAIANDTLIQKGLSENNITPAIKQEIEETYKANEKNVYTIYLLDSKGVILHRHPFWKDGKDQRGNSYADKPGVSHVLKKHESYISKVFYTESGKLTIAVLSPVYYKNKFVGIARLLTNISTISERFVKPVKAGEKGYAQLLNNRGILLSHPIAEHIGKNIMTTRKDKFPDFDWSELEDIVGRMTSGEEGVGIYHSIWWTEKEYAGRVKKLTSFVPIRFGNRLWSIGLTMSYDEIAGPINKNAIITFGFAGILILLFSAGGLAFYKTQKKKAVLEAIAESAEALRESEERFRVAFENAATGMALMANDGYFMKVNQSLCRILGYSEEELLDKTWVEITEPDDLKGCYDWLKRVKAGEQDAFEKRFIHKLGHPVWVMVNSSLVRGSQGQTRYYISLFQDITSRKEAEEALRESEEKFRVLTAMSPTGIYQTDVKGDCIYVNQRWCEMAGLSPEEAAGKGWIKGLHPEDRELIESEWSKMVESEGKWGLEYRFQNLDGKIIWAYGVVAPLRDDDGTITGYMGVNFDHTERKALEEELLKSRKLESVGILAGGIAHDFNNLLSIIMGNISMTKDDVKPEYGVTEFLNEAEEAALRAQELTTKLITFSKGGTPVKKTGAIGDLVKESTIFSISGSNVESEFSIPHDLWLVDFDEGQMRHAINNMIINTVESIPDGGTIDVRAGNCNITAKRDLPLPEGKYVKISIRDQGIGIPEEHLSKIFDPYFSTKEMGTQKGMGLGLATTYSIINRHDGHITVESEVGVGTTFTIYLPAHEKEVIALESIEILRPERPEIHTGRILLMDDEKSIRKASKQVLSRLGYDPDFAKDGTEAIELYKGAIESGRPFDTVILDLTIKEGMGGVDTIKKLIEIDPQISAIVSSGYSNDPVMTDYRAYGFIGALAKPYSKKDLSDALNKVIKE